MAYGFSARLRSQEAVTARPRSARCDSQLIESKSTDPAGKTPDRARAARGLVGRKRLVGSVVSWRGDFYLEDGLHRALRAALQQRQTMHARVLDLK